MGNIYLHFILITDSQICYHMPFFCLRACAKGSSSKVFACFPNSSSAKWNKDCFHQPQTKPRKTCSRHMSQKCGGSQGQVKDQKCSGGVFTTPQCHNTDPYEPVVSALKQGAQLTSPQSAEMCKNIFLYFYISLNITVNLN